MLSQNNRRDYIAYLSALTLLFSYAEMLLPRTIPFFRLGLANTIILLALRLRFRDFFALIFIKAIASSLMAGILFSPFFALSLTQSVSSGLAMYALFHIIERLGTSGQKLISLYGISMIGALASVSAQIEVASLYLGKGTYALFGPMMIFSLFASILTAFLALHLHIPSEAPALMKADSTAQEFTKTPSKAKRKIPTTALLIAIAAAAIFTLAQSDTRVLVVCLLHALIAQKISGRKIMFLPHISLWIFVIAANILTPSGKVFASISGFSFTEGALLVGIQQALKLSTVTALSQCAASLRPTGISLIARALAYFRGLSNVLRSTEGNILKKIKTALSATEVYD